MAGDAGSKHDDADQSVSDQVGALVAELQSLNYLRPPALSRVESADRDKFAIVQEIAADRPPTLAERRAKLGAGNWVSERFRAADVKGPTTPE